MKTINNRSNKPKKSSQDLVNMLRNEKGISFNIINENTAVDYFMTKNNYMRTAAYRKNYPKHKTGENRGKYISLDFAYLTELSTIDMYLRSILLQMCIDIEHALKVHLLTDIENNLDEDGYNIVDSFLRNNPNVSHSIAQKSTSIFTGNLINSYFDIKQSFDISKGWSRFVVSKFDCPIWVLLELISFNETIKLYNHYISVYPTSNIIQLDSNILNPIRSLRNACAHNNCLLVSLNPTSTTAPPSTVSKFVASISTIGKEERKKKLTCRPLFEITCMLYTYTQLVSMQVRENSLRELQNFVNGRMCKHQDYFKSNQTISTSYAFFKKIVDKLLET